MWLGPSHFVSHLLRQGCVQTPFFYHDNMKLAGVGEISAEFECSELRSHIPPLKSYKADYFINGTGRIGEQRHAVLLQVITVCKRHCTFVQRRRNS